MTFKEANPAIPASNLNEVEAFLKSKGESLDDLVDVVAKNDYLEDPYIKIQPQLQRHSSGTEISDETFAFGNDSVGYQLFVDGERVTDNNNIPYSEAEAQIQLRNAMEEGGDPLRVAGYDDYLEDAGAKHKGYVDNSLPGGSNYQEVVFNWDNAPVRHGGFAHFDDDNQIAHALTRDRVLADGTDTKHIDELQSDLHTKGSQDGYAIPKDVDKIKSQIKIKEQEILKQADIVEDMLVKKGVYTKQGPARSKEDYEISKYLEAIRTLEKETASAAKLTYDDVAYAADRLRHHLRIERDVVKRGSSDPTDFNFSMDEFETLNQLSNVTGQANDLERSLNNLVPNYPFKDDYHVMVLKNMLLDAIEEGKPALSVSGSAPIKARYHEKYHEFYSMLYDKKIPSAMKKLSNKYGGEFYKGNLDVENTFGSSTIDLDLLDANIIRITPEMKEKSAKEGIQSFGTGGIVESGIKNLDISKKQTTGIVGL